MHATSSAAGTTTHGIAHPLPAARSSIPRRAPRGHSHYPDARRPSATACQRLAKQAATVRAAAQHTQAAAELGPACQRYIAAEQARSQALLSALQPLTDQLEQEANELDWQLSVRVAGERRLPLPLQAGESTPIALLDQRTLGEEVGTPQGGSQYGPWIYTTETSTQGRTRHVLRCAPAQAADTAPAPSSQTQAAISSRVNKGDSSEADGGSKQQQQQQQPESVCVLDEGQEAAKHPENTGYALRTLRVSSDGAHVAWTDTRWLRPGRRRRGRQYTLHVRRVAAAFATAAVAAASGGGANTGALGADECRSVHGVAGPLAWSPCGLWLYYTTHRGHTLCSLDTTTLATTHTTHTDGPHVAQPHTPVVHTDTDYFDLTLRTVEVVSLQNLGHSKHGVTGLSGDGGYNSVTEGSKSVRGASQSVTRGHRLLVCDAVDTAQMTRELWACLPAPPHSAACPPGAAHAWRCVLPRQPGSRYVYLAVGAPPPDTQTHYTGDNTSTGSNNSAQQHQCVLGGGDVGLLVWHWSEGVPCGELFWVPTHTHHAPGHASNTARVVLLHERPGWRIVDVRVKGAGTDTGRTPVLLVTSLCVAGCSGGMAGGQGSTDNVGRVGGQVSTNSVVMFEVYGLEWGGEGGTTQQVPQWSLEAHTQVSFPSPAIHMSDIEWAYIRRGSHTSAGQYCVEGVYSSVGGQQLVLRVPLEPVTTHTLQPTQTTDTRHTEPPTGHTSCPCITLPTDLWVSVRHEQLTVTSQDGTRVYVTLAYDSEATGGRGGPVLIDVYGAYGTQDPVRYTPLRAMLLKRGWTIAVPHVRGGGGPWAHGDVGDPAWHTAGSGADKQRGVEDLLPVARALIGRSGTGLVSMCATSAGAWLAASALNTCPHLFRSVILTVPALDTLTGLEDNTHELISAACTSPAATGTHQEALGRGRDGVKGVPEADVAACLRWCPLATAPRVLATAPAGAPRVLVRVGLADTQVSAGEGVRYVAKLRHAMQRGRAGSAEHTTSQQGTERDPGLRVNTGQRASDHLGAASWNVTLVVSEGGHDAYGDSAGAAQAAAFLLQG